jgi:hypothetical protein
LVTGKDLKARAQFLFLILKTTPEVNRINDNPNPMYINGLPLLVDNLIEVTIFREVAWQHHIKCTTMISVVRYCLFWNRVLFRLKASPILVMQSY